MRSTLATVLVILFFLSSLAHSVPAQTPEQDDVIRVETDVTNLFFNATDAQRRFVITLNQDDIRVLEDGVPQQPVTFQRETDRPLSIAFLIDISVSEERTLADEKAAVRSFVESVIHSNKDQAAVIPFTGSAFLEQPLSRDVLGIYRALERVDVAMPDYLGAGKPISGIATGPGRKAIPPEGSTAIWDAIALSSNEEIGRAHV